MIMNDKMDFQCDLMKVFLSKEKMEQKSFNWIQTIELILL